MRKLMFLALGAIVGLSFTACGNKQAQTGVYSDSTEVDSSKLKDVVVYGLCGDNAAMNSLQMMTDMGDTLNLNIEEARENNQVFGNYAPGDRLAIVLTPDKKTVKSVINESVLMGKWLMPNPIDGSSEVGISIKDGGIAESIEQPTIIYKTWKIIDGKLEITLVREGGGDEEETNWYTIDKLDADSLVYHVNDEVFEYSRAK